MIEAGQRPEEVAYREQMSEMEKSQEVVDEIGPAGFVARGLRRRVIDVVETVKKRIATRRRNITTE